MKRWQVSDVAIVAAIEFGHPMTVVIFVKTGYPRL